MIFSQEVVGASNHLAQLQYNSVAEERNASNRINTNHAMIHRMAANEAGFIPTSLYQAFDEQKTEAFTGDDGDVFLNDLLPLSKSVSLGTLEYKWSNTSAGYGNAQTSMSGQLGVERDDVDYGSDGTIIPIHDIGFGTQWRRWHAEVNSGYDTLIDKDRESTRSIRKHLVDNFLNGHRNNDGTLIVHGGLSWGGMKNDARVNQVDLGAAGLNFDFSDNANTPEDNKANFITLKNILRNQNKIVAPATYYISLEIEEAWERDFSAQYNGGNIFEELRGLAGVADIKVSDALVGNEIMAYPLGQDYLRPLVGSALATVAMPRLVYNSNIEFVTWGAIGFQIRTDSAGKSPAMFAKG